MKRVIIIILLIYDTSIIYAKGLDDLLRYTVHDDTMINVNQARIISDQSSGLLTGGSILLRAPRPQEIFPLHLQLPNFRYDPCSGSGDFRFGALSYILNQIEELK